MSKATQIALSELHAALAKTLQEGLLILDEEGRPNSSLLSVARQFLKDNFITADTSASEGPLKGLAGLPVFEDENVVSIRKG